MKKLVIFITLSITLLILSACNQINYNPDISNVNATIRDFQLNNIDGYDLITEQYVNDVIMNSDHIKERIDRSDDIKIMTEHIQKRLLTFNTVSPYEITQKTYYFYQNQKGTQIEDEPVTWEDSTLEAYQTLVLPVQLIQADDFESFEVSKDNLKNTFVGVIKNSRIRSVLGYTIDTSQDIEFTFIYEPSTKTIIEIKITYTQEASHTDIVFKPFYGQTQVIMP